MKQIYLTLLIVLTACGGDPENVSTASLPCNNSPLIGNWTGTVAGSTDTMRIYSSCQGTSAVCGASFTVSPVTASSGSVSVNVTSSAGVAGCLPLGQTTCLYSVTGNSLAFDCGASVVNLTR